MSAKETWKQFGIVLAILAVGGAVWLAVYQPQLLAGHRDLDQSQQQAELASVQYGEVLDLTTVRVIDGDTLAIGEERVRIENIDTPETGHRAECEYERLGAIAATEIARQRFATARSAHIQRSGRDRYGRTLARISVDGADFGEWMIAGEHAVPWSGRQHDWCADMPGAATGQK